MRLNKYLQQAGVGSRREAERLIAEGLVTVDGRMAEVTTEVTDGATVKVRGVLVAPNAAPLPRVFLYHKPPGVIVTARDHEGRKTLYDALAELDVQKKLPRLMPVGRLDLNSEGLLLLTTDGQLAQTLMNPSTALERVYRVRVFGGLNGKQLELFRKGVKISDIEYRGAKIEEEHVSDSGKNRWYKVTLTEGKNREIRRIFEHFGCEVNRLQRVRYATFDLNSLPKGQLEEATASAVRFLLKVIGEKA